MEKNAILFRSQAEVTIATLQSSELTSVFEDSLSRKLQELISAGAVPKIVLDLSRLTFLGSTGVGALVAILGRIRKHNGQFAVVGLSGQARGVVEVCGLEKALMLFPDVPSAIQAMKRVPAAIPSH
jgi:anti-anti-sigma factor